MQHSGFKKEDVGLVPCVWKTGRMVCWAPRADGPHGSGADEEIHDAQVAQEDAPAARHLIRRDAEGRDDIMSIDK